MLRGRGSRGEPSSEAEMSHPLEGRSATLERGGDVSRGRESRGEPSSEAKMSDLLEGRSATLERGGDCSVSLRGVRMGHMLGFFESFSFLSDWKEAVGLCGPSCLNMCLRFNAILVPRLGCP